MHGPFGDLCMDGAVKSRRQVMRKKCQPSGRAVILCAKPRPSVARLTGYRFPRERTPPRNTVRLAPLRAADLASFLSSRLHYAPRHPAFSGPHPRAARPHSAGGTPRREPGHVRRMVRTARYRLLRRPARRPDPL